MKKVIEYYDEDGCEIEVELPANWKVCPSCNGRGTTTLHVDGHGMSRDEMNELGPEFIEDYLSGVYDKPCPECKGRTTVLEVDESRLTLEQKEHHEAWIQQKHEDAMLDMIAHQECMMGA